MFITVKRFGDLSISALGILAAPNSLCVSFTYGENQHEEERFTSRGSSRGSRARGMSEWNISYTIKIPSRVAPDIRPNKTNST